MQDGEEVPGNRSSGEEVARCMQDGKGGEGGSEILLCLHLICRVSCVMFYFYFTSFSSTSSPLSLFPIPLHLLSPPLPHPSPFLFFFPLLFPIPFLPLPLPSHHFNVRCSFLNGLTRPRRIKVTVATRAPH